MLVRTKSVSKDIHTLVIRLIRSSVAIIMLFVKKVLSSSTRSENSGIDDGRLPRIRRKRVFKPKNILKAFALIASVVAVVYVVSRVFVVRDGGKSEDVSILGARATQDIYREFSFPLKDSNGDDVSNIKYTIEKTELRDEIVVKGQKATAIEGRTFLIVTLKVKNEFDQAIEMSTRDYVRLSVNDNKDEWLAPDIHNDPVEIQAISTKYTRLGFPINDSDEKLVLRVGEIEGDKEEVELTF
jgi:hypothetical protein